MAAKESFIFCQDDLTKSSSSTFDDMRRKGELVDFIVTFQNRSFSGHRLVIAAAIPYFRNLFQSSRQEISLQEVNPDCLESVMEFAYSGRIEITSENVQSLILASKFLQLTQVHDACWEFLGKILRLNNVWEIRVIAEKHSCPEVMGLADSYIRQNFEAFSKSESFLALPFAYLKEVLCADDVKVSTETCVFEGVVRWVKNSPCERKDFLPDLLCAVRLHELFPDYLTEKVSTEELLRTSIPCRDLIDEAKLYCWAPFYAKPKISSFVTRPRIFGGKFQPLNCGGTDPSTISAFCSPMLDSESEKCTNLSSNFGASTQVYHFTAADKGEEIQDTVFVSGLPEGVNEDELSDYFGAIGIIKTDQWTGKKRIWIYKDKLTGKGKGEATITYYHPYTATFAINWFGGKDFQGKKIKVQLAQRKFAPMGDPGGGWGGREGGRCDLNDPATTSSTELSFDTPSSTSTATKATYSASVFSSGRRFAVPRRKHSVCQRATTGARAGFTFSQSTFVPRKHTVSPHPITVRNTFIPPSLFQLRETRYPYSPLTGFNSNFPKPDPFPP